MKSVYVSVLIAAMLVVTGASSSMAADYSFGVVDMNKVLEKSAAAKSIMSQLEAKKDVFKKEIESKEKELKASEQTIVKEKDNLSKNEFDQKREDFKKSVIAGQKMAQKNKVILDRGLALSMSKLREAVQKVITDIAKEKNYSAVFSQSTVMMADPSLDITDSVIKNLDSSVKEIKIDWAEASKLPASK